MGSGSGCRVKLRCIDRPMVAGVERMGEVIGPDVLGVVLCDEVA